MPWLAAAYGVQVDTGGQLSAAVVRILLLYFHDQGSMSHDNYRGMHILWSFACLILHTQLGLIWELCLAMGSKLNRAAIKVSNFLVVLGGGLKLETSIILQPHNGYYN